MIFVLLLLPIIAFAQDFSSAQFSTGVRSSYFLDDKKFDNTFLYYVPEYQDEKIGDVVTLKRQFKLRVFDYVSSDEKVIVDPLDVSAEWITDKYSFQIGFLRYRFSETFGTQLLDVANPRDYSEYIFNDLSWAKRSVFGMNGMTKWDSLEVQFMLTLWPNGDRLPYQGSAFDPFPKNVDFKGGVVDRPWFKDLEYGTRIKYLFQNGFDASLLYYHHFARPTYLNINPVGLAQFKATAKDRLVDSIGGSGSYVIKDWVIRGDVLFTHNDFVPKNILEFEEANHYQSLVGIDRTFEDYLLGLQTQSDYSANRHFYGVRLEKSNIDWFKPSVMYFKNYNKNDQWLQVKTRFEKASYRLDLVYDNIHGGKTTSEVFGFYRSNDRFLFDVQYTY